MKIERVRLRALPSAAKAKVAGRHPAGDAPQIAGGRAQQRGNQRGGGVVGKAVLVEDVGVALGRARAEHVGADAAGAAAARD